ncbi:predicted protein [Lichtheimia corymbifera JMRC:FSU:9682]|uniref:Uncharacterized protein n=1 Tax=Lichtheimia corymbifera JMRC:FSU:9682 TaxID=1263082 RepID=A0A068SH36_9FUNG|nr:predicted protein [Lichtheimia corymbifera JMRC:FSU:9682]
MKKTDKWVMHAIRWTLAFGDFVGCLELAGATAWQVFEEGKMRDPQVALDWFLRWVKDSDAQDQLPHKLARLFLVGKSYILFDT